MSNDNVKYSNILKKPDNAVDVKETVNKPKILKNIGKIPEETVVKSKIKTWNY